MHQKIIPNKVKKPDYLIPNKVSEKKAIPDNRILDFGNPLDPSFLVRFVIGMNFASQESTRAFDTTIGLGSKKPPSKL